MKTYQLFVKIEKENENDLLLTVSLLGLLGFFWRSESSSYRKIKNLEVVNRAMLFRDNDCGYIGFDASFEVQKITSSSDNIYYQTLQQYEEDNKDHPHILISPKELFNLFKQFHEEYKLPDPEFPSRLDVLKNPCITVSEDYDLVFKNNQIYAYSIDPEVEPDICRLLKNNEALWLTKLNDSVHSFQRRYSRRTDFKEAVIQRLVKHLKTNL